MEYFGVADIGGTHARYGVVRSDEYGLRLVAFDSCKTDSAVVSTMQEYFDGSQFALSHIVLACAGPVVDNKVCKLRNADVHILSGDFGGAAVLNDIESLGYSLDYVINRELPVHLVSSGSLQNVKLEDQDGSALIITLGTGLGMCHVERFKGSIRVNPLEFGHASYAFPADLEAFSDLFVSVTNKPDVVAEDIFSGKGLLSIISTCLTHHDLVNHALLSIPGLRTYKHHVSSSVLAELKAAKSTGAALHYFLSLDEEVVTFVKDLYMYLFSDYIARVKQQFNPTLGVFLGGGVLQKHHSFLTSAFLKDNLPTLYLIPHQQYALLGAAWFASIGKLNK